VKFLSGRKQALFADCEVASANHPVGLDGGVGYGAWACRFCTWYAVLRLTVRTTIFEVWGRKEFIEDGNGICMYELHPTGRYQKVADESSHICSG
jgi:hypothetical protein